MARLVDRINARLAESRAITGVPWRPWDSPYARFDTGGPAHPSRMGETGQDGALALAALYSSVRLIAEGVAKIPVSQYRDAGGRKVKMPAGPLVTSPSVCLRPFDWKLTGMTSVLLHGMAYGLITSRDGYQNPVAAEWLPPGLMHVQDSVPFNPARARFFYAGREVPRENLLIMRGLSVAGQTEAVSPLKAFQMLIGAGHKALGYGSGWYESGGFPPGTFQNTEYEIDDEQSAKIKNKLVRAQRRREPLVFGRDWTYTPITVPPEQAQFIESQRLTATQIAAIYGVPPERVGGTRGDTMHYSSDEQSAIALVTETLDPWLVRFEEMYYECLPRPQYAVFDRDARIRHDITTRYNAYRTARDIGLMNVDQIREKEDMEPLPRPVAASDYDGKDYTPLMIMVAAARGLKEELGSGTGGAPQQNPQQQAQPGARPARPGPVNQVPPAPAANGHGKATRMRRFDPWIDEG